MEVIIQVMVRSSPDYSLLTDYLATSGIHRDIKFSYGSWVTTLGRDRDPAYHQAMEQVAGGCWAGIFITFVLRWCPGPGPIMTRCWSASSAS